ncbi:hypothetical protein ABZ215_38500 [Amycolatopsis sp. NPDC006131]|uniref:hypothetical protein n=1 Tax=Amycolatopsis sp. NPDC006131 TaxID=3156731 RepID=UPI0033B00893
MAEKTVALKDTFPGSTLDPAKWATLNGAPTYLSDNRAELPCTASIPEIRSVALWDLTSSQFSVKVTPPPLTPGVAVALALEQNPTNHVSFLLEVGDGGDAVFIPRKVVAGNTTDVRVPYDQKAHVFWRLREQNGYVAWETSPNGQFWELQRHEAVGALDLSLVTVRFLCGLV